MKENCTAHNTILLPLDDDSTDTMILPDGRTLCFASYGASTGPVVFYLHGGGDARKGGAFFDEPAQSLGVRIIACDRPGTGRSSPQPNRTVLDHARDIELLAEHLSINEYYVIGVSGGGPYALACASSIPAEQLKGVAVVCGMASPDINLAYSGWSLWALLKAHEYCPSIVRWYTNEVHAWMMEQPIEKLREMYQKPNRFFSWMALNEKDAQVLDDDSVIALIKAANHEYLLQGTGAIVEEGRVWISELGFRLEDIRNNLPVHLWYGKQDSGVPPRLGKEIAARLGGSAALHVVDEGHISLVVNHGMSILRSLLGRA